MMNISQDSDPSENTASRESWLSYCQNGVFHGDLDGGLKAALWGYLADLGICVELDSGLWSVPGIDLSNAPSEIAGDLEEKLKRAVKTEKGFALKHFLAGHEDEEKRSSVIPKRPGFASPPRPHAAGESLKPKRPAHDLSNLQIVKKVGRQMESFLDQEKQFFEQVLGPSVSRKDAQVLFNYVISRTRQKVEPQKWVQLSRRRHK